MSRRASLALFALMLGAGACDGPDPRELSFDLATPNNVAASDGAFDDRVQITWEDRSDVENGYRVFRNGQLITTTAPGTILYNDSDAVPGGLFEYCVAGLRDDPTRRYPPIDRPTPITVVATDGSQIYPDRHVEPHCYLLNISRIAFQYGTVERPLMESVPRFEYRREAFDEAFDQVLGTATADVVSALRDEFELAALFDVAQKARMPGRPILALADGTLIRWMLRRMRDYALEQKLIDRYTDTLAHFQADGIPLCSYISMPGNTEVVNLLRVHRGESDDEPDPDASLAGVPDRWLFERILQPGERSAVFESASHIQKEYGARDRICYFYVAARHGWFMLPCLGRASSLIRHSKMS